MSTAVLEQVIQRAMDDEAFRDQISSNPAGALGAYDLSEEERIALANGDQAKLTTLGVPEKLSKGLKFK